MKLTALEKASRKIKRAKEKLDEAIEERAVILRNTYVICENQYANRFNRPDAQPCGKATEIGKLTFIRLLYYVPPSGCMEGDYWQADERDGLFVCPHCNYVNRLYARKDVLALRSYFGSTENREMR